MTRSPRISISIRTLLSDTCYHYPGENKGDEQRVHQIDYPEVEVYYGRQNFTCNEEFSVVGFSLLPSYPLMFSGREVFSSFI